jgi:phage terminase large subunit-like protein
LSIALLTLDEIEIALENKLITPAQAAWALDEIERERCKDDLFYLAHDILGYSDLTESIHRPLCELVSSINPLMVELSIRKSNDTRRLGVLNSQKSGSGGTGGEGEGKIDPTQNFIKNFTLPNNESINNLVAANIIQFNPEARTRLFLLFRGAFKSTIITIAHTIQLMLIWPDIRILIASHKKEGGSQKFLGSIKDHFLRNERFRKLFPEYCPKANSSGQIDWGTSEQVTLPNRSATAIYPEATIEIAGATTDVTGRHYNYLKIDDIVTRESVTNEQMLERTEEFNALLTFLFDNPEWGIADYAGTCYHFADLYAQLRESPQITKFILPVWNEAKEPTVPERFTSSGIEAIRNHPSMTSFQFSAQYMMNPVPEEDQTFRPEYWRMPGFYYDKLPDNLRIGVFVDPANKQRKDSDYTALMTIGIDSVGDWYLIDIIRDKLTLDQRAKLVLKILMAHGIHQCNYESIGFQSSDIKAIKEMGMTADWHISVNEIKASRQSKEDRIRGLQYLYEQGKVHWPKSYKYFSKYHNREFDMVEILRREMWMFPKCEKDDLADCHSFPLRTSMIKGSKPGVAKEVDFLDHLIEKLVLNKGANEIKGKGNELRYRDSIW